MTDPGNQYVRELETWADGLQQRAQRYGQLQQRMNETSVTETSGDGAVRITVDSNGSPTELTVTDRGRGMEPRDLTSALNGTLRRAQAKLRDQVSELAQSVVGDETPANNIVQQYRDRFPDAPEEEPRRTDIETMRIDDIDDDDWNDGRSRR